MRAYAADLDQATDRRELEATIRRFARRRPVIERNDVRILAGLLRLGEPACVIAQPSPSSTITLPASAGARSQPRARSAGGAASDRQRRAGDGARAAAAKANAPAGGGSSSSGGGAAKPRSGGGASSPSARRPDDPKAPGASTPSGGAGATSQPPPSPPPAPSTPPRRQQRRATEALQAAKELQATARSDRPSTLRTPGEPRWHRPDMSRPRGRRAPRSGAEAPPEGYP